MKILARSVLFILTICLFSLAQAGDRRGTVHYTGIGFDTSFDVDTSHAMNLPLGMIHADSFGTYGDSSTTIVYEFGSDEVQGSCGPYEYEFDLLSARVVITFADHSQLYLKISGGKMCLNMLTGEFLGTSLGIADGGTGKFEGAEGDFTGTYSGRNFFDPETNGLIAITGTMEGSLAK